VQGYLIQKPCLETRDLLASYDAIHQLNLEDKRKPGGKEIQIIKNEIVYIEPIHYNSSLVQVLDRFKNNVADTFFPVIGSDNEPMGIIREEQLREYAYSKYGRSLLVNRSLNQNLDEFITKIPVVDIHTSVENTLEVYAGSDTKEGIIITNGTKYIGFLGAHALFKITNEKNLNAARDQNPLTKLPGNERIYEYVSKALIDGDHTYVLAYFDFDNFKVYNDTYGFRQGDRVILLFAELLKQYTQSPERFAGHVGGDDFFMGTKGIALDSLADEVKVMAETFRTNVESFYDAKAIKNGCIRSLGRDGEEKCFPLITVSSVLIELPAKMHRIITTEELGNIMADMKKEAKRSPEKQCVRSLDHFSNHSVDTSDHAASRIIPFHTQTMR
jgi:diguanylate cyclase (GGDEF)-like protein